MTANVGVSVIIAAYRAHDTIVRAVESLLAQTVTDWQAVIADDDGGDYRAIIKTAGIDDPRLTFVSSGGIATGAAAARNSGLAAASGAFVTVLDADDCFAPQRLSRLLEVAMVHGAAVDNVSVVRDSDNTPLSTLFSPGQAPTTLDAAGFLATSVPMFPLVQRQYVPGWQADITFCDDVIFNIQLIDTIGAIKVVDSPLYQYRQREGSITYAPDAGQRADACYCHVLNRLDDDGLGIQSEEIKLLLKASIRQKRALNAAYEAAFLAGFCENFQEFLALGATETQSTP